MGSAANRLTAVLLLSAALHAALIGLAPRMRPSHALPAAPASNTSPIQVRLHARTASTPPEPAAAPRHARVPDSARAAAPLPRAPVAGRPATATRTPDAPPAPSPTPTASAPAADTASPSAPSAPFSGAEQPAAASTSAAPGTALLDAARRDAAQFARELGKQPGPKPVLRAERQGRLERGIDEAYAAAHGSAGADATRASDGRDWYYRFKTPFGTSVCLLNRDRDRTNSSLGRVNVVGLCNR